MRNFERMSHIVKSIEDVLSLQTSGKLSPQQAHRAVNLLLADGESAINKPTTSTSSDACAKVLATVAKPDEAAEKAAQEEDDKATPVLGKSAGGSVESSGGTWTTIASKTLPRPKTGPTAGSKTGGQNNELFRTQFCYFRGKCRKVNCPFAHTCEELRVHPRKNTKMCWWREDCTNEDCRYAHTRDELRVPDT